MNQWDEALSTAQRVLRKAIQFFSHNCADLCSQDALDLDALRLNALYLLTREAKSSAAENKIAELMDVRCVLPSGAAALLDYSDVDVAIAVAGH